MMSASPSGQRRKADGGLRDVLDATTDAIAVHRNGRIVYANGAGLALFGFDSLDQVAGRAPLEFVSDAYRDVVTDRFAQTSRTAEIEERLLHRDGHEIPVEVFSLPIVFDGAPATLVHMRDLRVRRSSRSDCALLIGWLGSGSWPRASRTKSTHR